MSERKIAILGGGRIGEALLSGLLSSGWRDPSEIVVTSRRDERRTELRERYGVEATADNVAAVTGAGLVVVAVKPQDIDVLLGEIGEHLTPGQTLVSVAAAIPTARIEDRSCGRSPGRASHAELTRDRARGHGRDLRGQPRRRRPARARRGAALASRPRRARARVVDGRDHRGFRLRPRLLRAAGRGDDRGGNPARLSREVSTTLVVQTMFGTAKQLRDQGMHPVELRESVTSPGGTTIAAIRELEQAGVRAAFLNAIQAAMDRARELAEGG